MASCAILFIGQVRGRKLSREADKNDIATHDASQCSEGRRRAKCSKKPRLFPSKKSPKKCLPRKGVRGSACSAL